MLDVIFALTLAGVVPATDPSADLRAYVDPSREPYWPLVRSFLYMSTIERNGNTYAAALYANDDENGLAALGVLGDPNAEVVRKAMEADYQAHQTEYFARARLVHAKSGLPGYDTGAGLQLNLWRIFLDDPRYRSRIEAQVRAALGLPALGAERSSLELVASPAAIQDIADGLLRVLNNRSAEPGCGANPILAFEHIGEADPMLATDIYLELQATDFKAVDATQLEASLRRRGWRIGSDAATHPTQPSRRD